MVSVSCSMLGISFALFAASVHGAERTCVREGGSDLERGRHSFSRKYQTRTWQQTHASKHTAPGTVELDLKS